MPAGPIEQTAPAPQILQVESSEPTKAKLKGRLPIPKVVAVLAFTVALGVFAGACNEENQALTTTPTATSVATIIPTREPTQPATPSPERTTPTVEPGSPTSSPDITTPIVQAESSTPEISPTPTAEWFGKGHWVAPGETDRERLLDNEGYGIDELVIAVEEGISDQKTAEILTEHGIEIMYDTNRRIGVVRRTPRYPGYSFLALVDPKERDAVLNSFHCENNPDVNCWVDGIEFVEKNGSGPIPNPPQN
jgi:hypothetical protein